MILEILELVRIIKFKYILFIDNFKKFLEVKVIIDKSFLDFNFLVKVESLYYDIIRYYNILRSIKLEVVVFVEKYKIKFEKELLKSEFYRFRFFYFIIVKLVCIICYDYCGFLKVCKEVIVDLEKRKVVIFFVIVVFFYFIFVVVIMFG